MSLGRVQPPSVGSFKLSICLAKVKSQLHKNPPPLRSSPRLRWLSSPQPLIRPAPDPWLSALSPSAIHGRSRTQSQSLAAACIIMAYIIAFALPCDVEIRCAFKKTVMHAQRRPTPHTLQTITARQPVWKWSRIARFSLQLSSNVRHDRYAP